MSNKVMVSKRKVLNFFVVCMAFLGLMFGQRFFVYAGNIEDVAMEYKFEDKTNHLFIRPAVEDDYKRLAEVLLKYSKDELKLVTLENVEDLFKIHTSEKAQEILRKDTTYGKGRKIDYVVEDLSKKKEIVGMVSLLVFNTPEKSKMFTTSVLLDREYRKIGGFKGDSDRIRKGLIGLVSGLTESLRECDDVVAYFAGIIDLQKKLKENNPGVVMLRKLFKQISKLECNEKTGYSSFSDKLTSVELEKIGFSFEKSDFKLFFAYKESLKGLAENIKKLLESKEKRGLVVDLVKETGVKPKTLSELLSNLLDKTSKWFNLFSLIK